jgi:hypothetical protein
MYKQQQQHAIVRAATAAEGYTVFCLSLSPCSVCCLSAHMLVQGTFVACHISSSLDSLPLAQCQPGIGNAAAIQQKSMSCCL